MQAASPGAQDIDRAAQIEARRELAGIGIQFGAPALIHAAANHDTLALSLLLDAGVDVNASVDGQTALMAAVESGVPEARDLLLEKGADVHAADRSGNTVLHAARSVETVALLVEKGAAVNARNNAGETALWRSVARLQDRQLAIALLDAGARPERPSHEEPSELAYAFEWRDAGLIRMLAERGADVDSPARQTWPGEPNVYYGSYSIDTGPPPGTPTYWEGSLLFKALFDNDMAMVNLLLDLGASPDRLAFNHKRESHRGQTVNGEYWTYTFTYSAKSTPFMLAIQRKELALAERMLDAGADANTIFHDRFRFRNGEVESDSHSALLSAIEADSAGLVARLLEHGADVKAEPCVLHRAALHADVDMVRLLLEAGADVDALCTWHGEAWSNETALYVAVAFAPDGNSHEKMARRKVVEALLGGGADVNRSGSRSLPIHAAVNGSFGSDAENLELLIEAGANLDTIVTGHSGTPLHIAAGTSWSVENAATKVRVLIDGCADLNIKTRGRTPLDVAFDNLGSRYSGATSAADRLEIVALLSEAKGRQRQLGCR